MTAINIKGGVLRAIDGSAGTAITANGWIEDEKFGWYGRSFANAWAAKFDSLVTRTGLKTLKLSTTNVTGRVGARLWPSTTTPTLDQLYKYGIAVKSATTYRFKCKVNTSNVAANAVYADITTYTAAVVETTRPTNKLTGTNDWTNITLTFTTGASEIFALITLFNVVAGNISDAWFDINSMTLEEVTTVTNSLSNPAFFKPVLVGVTDVLSIDQSNDEGGAYVNTTTSAASETETAAGRTAFVAAKKYISFIAVKIVNRGVGTRVKLLLHDSSNRCVGGTKDPNTGTPIASITNGQFFLFPIGGIVTPGTTYHFHVISDGADATFQTLNANDASVCSYVIYYGKKTNNISIATDTELLSLSGDTDGLAHGATFDLVNGLYTYAADYHQANGAVTSIPNWADIFSYTGYTTSCPTSIYTNGMNVSASTTNFVLKFNVLFPMSSLTAIFKSVVAATRSYKIQYSFDNATWVDLNTYVAADNGVLKTETIPVAGQTVFYLRAVGISSTCYLQTLSISASIDISAIKFPTLAVGSNNAYLSSNSAIADTGNDPSFQATFSSFGLTAAGRALKVFLNGAWVTKPIKVFLNGAWTQKIIKRYNGSTWS